MEDQFKLLIINDDTIDAHAGENCDLYKEVILSPTRKQLAEYKLFFRGIIRSVWNDVSKNIEVVCDAGDGYRVILDDLKTVMEAEESITFTLK
jgi:hypothetical protein